MLPGHGGRSVLAVFEEESGGQCDGNPFGGGKGDDEWPMDFTLSEKDVLGGRGGDVQ